MAKSNHYVRNEEFLAAHAKYKQDCKDAKKAGKPKPNIPDSICQSLMLIAENLSHKPNFIGYSYRDEMVADAIENCIMYFDNFDPRIKKNPFAYFTQISFYAFIRRIQKEKKQQYTKYKIAQHQGIMGEEEFLENEDGTVRQIELYENISDFIGTYEESKEKKKKPKKKNKLENFMEDDDA